MPEIRVPIGDRTYTVACQAGEELHLQTAGSMLDKEAKVVLQAAPNVSEAQLLLMAGLMLADKMSAGGEQSAYSEHQVNDLQAKLAVSEKKAADLTKALDAATPAAEPTKGTEVDLLEKMAVELERLADEMEAVSA